LAEPKSLKTLPPENNKSGKKTVKFRMLYQALTKVDPLPGKETGPVIFVIRQRQEPLTVYESGFQLFASEVNTWLHGTFCPFSVFSKRGDKKGQKVPKRDITVPFIHGARPEGLVKKR
jgi:hypothetical protein